MERFKRTIKKIAAFAGGAIMVGSALTGALAALENLPQPFVTSAGVFDSYIVVGTLGWNPNAAYNADAVTGLARDVSAGIDVGASFAQVATTEADDSGVTTTVSEGVMLEQAGAVLGYGEDIAAAAPTGISDADLPVILKEETFKESKGDASNDVDYEQTIEFNPNNIDAGNVTFGQDDDKVTGTWIVFDNGDEIYNYTVDFDDEVDYTDGSENDDFDGATIRLQGKSYTIASATADATGLSQLELLSGAVQTTQGEYTTQTYTVDGNSYEVEVLIISDDDDEVQFRINGETTDVLAEGDTYELSDGMEIGVDFVTPNEGSEAAGADQVTFYLGAQKLEINRGDEININGKTVTDYETKGYFVNVDTDSFDQIAIELAPEDDIYLGEGESWVDPVFGQWKFVFAGIEKDVEEISLDVSGGDDGWLTFNNNEGDEVEVPIVLETASDAVCLGDDENFCDGDASNGEGNNTVAPKTLSTGFGMAITDQDTCYSSDADMMDDCSGFLFMAISANNEARLYSIKDIDTVAKTFDIYDEQTNDRVKDDASCDSADTVAITGMGNFEFDCETDDAIFEFEDIDLADDGDMHTELGMEIDFATDEANSEVDIAIIDADGNTDTHVIDDDGSDDMQIEEGLTNSFTAEEEDSDIEWALDDANWGILYKNADKDDDNDWTIYYPEEIKDGSGVSIELYVSPTGATTAVASSGSVNVNYINAATGISRTDQDFATAVPNKNVVLMAGPTVNELVSDLAAAGETWTSAEWADKVDTAIIELVEDAFGTYDALIIAGYDAKDTALAGKVVASRLTQGNFADELTGSMVELSTAGASTVNEVTFA